jgi:niacin transporter
MKKRLNTRTLTLTALFAAIGVVLPLVVHVFGQTLGRVFLPMHIAVILAGLLLGIAPGIYVAVLSMLLNFLIIGMPPPPMLWFMLAELVIYAVIAGLFRKYIKNSEPEYKFWKNTITRSYISLITVLVVGRLIYAGFLAVLLAAFGLSGGAATVIPGFVTGIPGVILQAVVIPLLIVTFKRAGVLDEPKS